MPRKPPTELKRDHDSAFVRWKGKKVFFGRWGSAEAQREFAGWLMALSKEQSPPPPATRITVAACIDRFLQYCATYYPPQEQLNIKAAMDSLFTFAGEDRAVDFGPKMLKDFQKALAQKTDADGNLFFARSTINARVDRVRRCFRWCASEELIPAEISTALTTVPSIPKGRGMARETAEIQPVPASVVSLTLPFLSPTVSAMVRVQYLCGMRPQDVCGMTTGQVDRSSQIWIYRPERHKGSHRGAVLTKAIPPAAQTILLPFLRANADEPLFSPLDTMKYFGSQWKTRSRQQYSTAAYGKSIVYAIARAARQDPPIKIPHWTPNQLRHAIATDIRRTVGIEAAQNYLGHTRPDTTLIYAEQSATAVTSTASVIVSPFVPDYRQPPAP